MYLYQMIDNNGKSYEEHGDSITDVMNFMARSFPAVIIVEIKTK